MSGVNGPRSQSSAWGAGGGLARLEWKILGPLAVVADVAAMFRITHDLFYFAPDTTTGYQVPVVGVEAALGLAAIFP